MITAHAHVKKENVKKENYGLKMLWNNKQMLNGCLLTQNFVHGVKKLYKEVQDVILWCAFMGKTFATCVLVLGLGSLTIKIILNTIFIKKVRMSKLIGKNKSFKKWISIHKDF